MCRKWLFVIAQMSVFFSKSFIDQEEFWCFSIPKCKFQHLADLTEVLLSLPPPPKGLTKLYRTSCTNWSPDSSKVRANSRVIVETRADFQPDSAFVVCVLMRCFSLSQAAQQLCHCLCKYKVKWEDVHVRSFQSIQRVQNLKSHLNIFNCLCFHKFFVIC